MKTEKEKTFDSCEENMEKTDLQELITETEDGLICKIEEARKQLNSEIERYSHR